MPAKIQLYSFAQLEAIWIQAGGDRASAPIMAAIALAESSGNPTATNKNRDGSIDRGLWQINSSNVDSTSMFNPADNAKEAVKLKNSGQGLRNWVTYNNGKYRDFLKGNVAPDPSGLPSGSTATGSTQDASLAGDLGSAIGQGLGDGLKAVIQPLVEMSMWATETLFGIGLMVGGVIIFVMNTNSGKNAGNTTINLAGTALEAAAPETVPELAALSRIRSASGRRAIVRERAREAARNSPRGRQAAAQQAAQQREKRVQAEQRRQTERKAIRQEAVRRNRGNSSTGNSKG